MPFISRYAVILPVTAAICFLTVSCGESKVSQCKKIILVANQAVNETGVVTNFGRNGDSKALLKTVDIWEKAAKEMETLKVNDEKLKDYQSRFIKMYRDANPLIRNLVAALQKKDRPTTDAALKNLQQVTTATEEKLVSQINTYCASK